MFIFGKDQWCSLIIVSVKYLYYLLKYHFKFFNIFILYKSKIKFVILEDHDTCFQVTQSSYFSSKICPQPDFYINTLSIIINILSFFMHMYICACSPLYNNSSYHLANTQINFGRKIIYMN